MEKYVDSRTVVNGKPMYEQCDRCDYDDHICPGCGTYLTHSGHESGKRLHNSTRPYCYE